ncbi:prepilin-type N-terminal cleavage/methylation domain-containing protein [Abyssalbus ytuae]|uniref:Prepilin-type N-terminal cleavage/methylation domain-containing protein n=1 Tax=Abyssalbus ytuae TaxID=2926907 RepID=A0A9E6ZNE5_9FLAO|nr:prepilin-type N-terminal cleavage/methylation domain-containing protein [Abyssalbus ytuae]UOB17899.1 prepilin-type N-terminal cleavage/methylation domain-containing protein [Abyssalbus ytuae]
MKAKNKIKAFTLSEMMVAIVITLLVVGMAFSVLGLIRKHMNGIAYNLNKSTQINLLEQSLWINFNRYEFAEYKNSTLKLKNKIDSVTYHILKEKVIKNADTLNVKVYGITPFFNGKKIKSGKIDAIRLFLSGDDDKTIFVYKINNAAQYIN